MNLVSLLILPAVISLRNNNPVRYTIAGVALVVLLAAIAFSKRTVSEDQRMVGGPEAPPAPAPTLSAAIDTMNGSRDDALKAAIDQWIDDAGHEQQHLELRDQLLEVKRRLGP
jgi:hypothetical protein